MEFKYFTKFIASDLSINNSDINSVKDAPNKLLLKGILIDNTANKNGWCIEQDDFQQVAKEFIGVQLRMNHDEKVTSVLGKVIATELDGPHDVDKFEWDPATEFPHIHFQAEITSEDSNVMIPIKLGYISSVSPAVDAMKILCSECKKPMIHNGYQHVKACNCENSVKLLKELTPRELSIVVSPAYVGTVMKSYGFAAAVDREFLSENRILEIVEDEIVKRKL